MFLGDPCASVTDVVSILILIFFHLIFQAAKLSGVTQHMLVHSSIVVPTLRSVHTVVHEAILPRTFVRVRPSQPRTRTKVRVRVRVRRPPTMLDFLYVVHVYDVQMFELAVFR